MSRITTSRPSAFARSIPSRTALTGSLRSLGVDRDVDLRAELDQLVDRGRALQVGGDERRASGRPSRAGARACRRRSSCPSPGARRAGSSSAAAARTRGASRRTQQLGQLVVDDLHDLLAGRQALPDVLAERALAHVRDELLDDVEVDVGLEQREAHLAHRAGDRLLVEDAAPAEVAERALELV